MATGGQSYQTDKSAQITGQYFDEESGLHYNLNRYYDPGTGRYITQDPLGIAGGLNPYQYCQNPVNWIDPLGLFNVSRNGKGGSLTGKPTKIPHSSTSDDIRSIMRENESAQILANNGYHVEQNPITPGLKNPDYKINGEIFDNIAPITNSVRNIYDRALKKINADQTKSVVINLTDTKVSVGDLQK